MKARWIVRGIGGGWLGILAAALASGCGVEEVGPESTQPAPPAPEVTLLDCAGEHGCERGPEARPLWCTAHDQCASDTCDRDAAPGAILGMCVPAAAVVYVDRAAPACETGDGSRAAPVCEISAALSRITPGRRAIRVYPGHYFPFAASAITVRVFGPGDGTAIVGEEDIGAGVRVTSGARVLLDGLTFATSVRTGVLCDTSELKLVRGEARGDNLGISAIDCALVVDRVRASGLFRAGLSIAGGTYRVTNSYFRGGDRPAVVFTGAATGTFAFNTVAGGGEISPGGIDCGTSSRLITDSIVYGNFPAAGGAQTIGACTHARVVVGTGDTRPVLGLIRLDPDLDDDGRLRDTPQNHACCIDRGGPLVWSARRDYDGTPRPQGPHSDIGAHELPQ